MSEVGSWDPAAQTPSELDAEFLRASLLRFADCEAEQFRARFSAEEQRRHADLMRCPWPAWRALAQEFSLQELLQLIRFLTLAEMHFPDGRVGEHSPVIPLAQELRARGCELERELLLWIRTHSDNRYLPYGAALPG